MVNRRLITYIGRTVGWIMRCINYASIGLVAGICLSLSPASADDWGCKVLLCLSNPGGPTEFDACKPPIDQLRKHLRKGRSFPTCSGAGFTTSQPVHDPYRCDGGLQLMQDDAGVVCRSAERNQPSTQCNAETTSGFEGRSSTAQYVVENGQYACRDYSYAAAIVQENPRYVDVMLENGGTTRVRF
jgi:hypothetical protein